MTRSSEPKPSEPPPAPDAEHSSLLLALYKSLALVWALSLLGGVEIPVRHTSPLAAALERVGDRWTLLLVAALLDGPRRFGELQEEVSGIAPNVLSQRLRALERNALVVAQPYSERPPRYEYLLTDSGMDLQPILLALKEWGDRYCNPGAEPVIFQHTCGADFHPVTVCAACQEPLRDGELTVTGGTHPATTRGST